MISGSGPMHGQCFERSLQKTSSSSYSLQLLNDVVCQDQFRRRCMIPLRYYLQLSQIYRLFRFNSHSVFF